MRTSFSLGQVRHFLAILFAACATTYSVLWIVHQSTQHAQPGFTSYGYSATTRTVTVGEVFAGSAAERAGLRPGDQIVAIDGEDLKDLRPFYEAMIAGQKEIIALTVEQPRSAAGQRQLKLVVGGGKPVPKRTLRLGDLLALPLDYYPVGFLVVGVTVLLLRPNDRNAWLLALLFGGFLANAPLYEGNIPTTVAQIRCLLQDCHDVVFDGPLLLLLCCVSRLLPHRSKDPEAEICSPGSRDNHQRPHRVPLPACRWNLALISRPALARNDRSQLGSHRPGWLAYSCSS
jgi:hypothetical protein